MSSWLAGRRISKQSQGIACDFEGANNRPAQPFRIMMVCENCRASLSAAPLPTSK
jgi:hypothetical protein